MLKEQLAGIVRQEGDALEQRQQVAAAQQEVERARTQLSQQRAALEAAQAQASQGVGVGGRQACSFACNGNAARTHSQNK